MWYNIDMNDEEIYKLYIQNLDNFGPGEIWFIESDDSWDLEDLLWENIENLQGGW